jgi:non-heme chloroperoxidase
MFAKRHPDTGSIQFGWREAVAYTTTALFFLTRKRAKLPMTALSRMSAMDIRALPPVQKFMASDGETLAYRTYHGPENRQIVMIHGSACFGDQLHKLATRFAQEAAATVHTVDMRGHGQNARGSAPAERYAMDVGEFCALLKRHPARPQVILAGHSAGGGLSLNVAYSPYVRNIDGMLLMAPYLGIASGSVRPYFGGWLVSIAWIKLMGTAVLNVMGVTRFNDRPLVAFDREVCLHDPRFVREWSFNTLLGFGPGRVRSASAEMLSSKIPTMLISGDRDECFRPDRYKAIIDRIAPWASIQLFSGLGHWDILADNRVASFCVNWLERQFAIEQRVQRGEIKDVKTA